MKERINALSINKRMMPLQTISRIGNPLIALDYEGVICNPAIDFAWLVYLKLVSEETKRRFPEELLRAFDKYDDVRWKRERGKKGHSTGTTPLVIECVAACDGIGDDRLIPFAQSVVQENPGVKELIEFLIEQGAVPYFITNSYPALALTTTYEYGIPSSNVFTHGYQISSKARKDFDRRRQSGQSTFEEEVISRSPMTTLLRFRENLRDFLEDYLLVTCSLLSAYKSEESSIIKFYTKNLNQLIGAVEEKELRKTLESMFFKESAIMGGHNKRRVLQRISHSSDGVGVVYPGDSIVDADAIAFAQYGVAVNCTDKYALQAAKLSLAVPDFSLPIPLFGDILKGTFSSEKAKKYERGGMKVFLPNEIEGRFDYVKSANDEVKSALKDLYKR